METHDNQQESTWPSLRRLLQRQGPPTSWTPLWEIIRGWPAPDERRDVVIPYCIEHLNARKAFQGFYRTPWSQTFAEARALLAQGRLRQDLSEVSERLKPSLIPGMRVGQVRTYRLEPWELLSPFQLFRAHLTAEEMGLRPPGPSLLCESSLVLAVAYTHRNYGIDGSSGEVDEFSRLTLALTPHGWLWERAPLWLSTRHGIQYS